MTPSPSPASTLYPTSTAPRPQAMTEDITANPTPNSANSVTGEEEPFSTLVTQDMGQPEPAPAEGSTARKGGLPSGGTKTALSAAILPSITASITQTSPAGSASPPGATTGSEQEASAPIAVSTLPTTAQQALADGYLGKQVSQDESDGSKETQPPAATPLPTTACDLGSNGPAQPVAVPIIAIAHPPLPSRPDNAASTEADNGGMEIGQGTDVHTANPVQPVPTVTPAHAGRNPSLSADGMSMPLLRSASGKPEGTQNPSFSIDPSLASVGDRQGIGSVAATPSSSFGNGSPATISAHPGRIGQDLGVAIARHVDQAGRNDPDVLVLRLDPPEHGRIEVRLHLSEGAPIRAAVTASHQATLDLLRRDSTDLMRALDQAGVSTDDRSFSFTQSGGEERQFHKMPYNRSAAAGDPGDTSMLPDTSVAATEPDWKPLRGSGTINMLT